MAKHKIFDTFQTALAKVPLGSAIKIEAEGLVICVVNHQGQLYGIENSCPHLGDSLANGTINYLGEVVCPWHAYRFSLMTGREASNRCRDAMTYPIDIEDHGVYLTL